MKTPQLPVPALQAVLGFDQEIWFKREDLHHHGSHKGRSIPLMIDDAARLGSRRFAISSSGNAAISAVIAVQNHNKSKPADPYWLSVFVGLHIDGKKLKKLTTLIGDAHITLEQAERPQQQAFLAAKQEGVKLLRQSTDDAALRGYLDLAKELARIPELAAVFMPTSSGTTIQGLSAGFERAGVNPELHIVQTSGCHPLADVFNSDCPPAEISLASAIVDRVAYRREPVKLAIAKSNGSAWIITNEEIKSAQDLVAASLNLQVSPTSALSVAALRRAIKTRQFKGPIVCMITGD